VCPAAALEAVPEEGLVAAAQGVVVAPVTPAPQQTKLAEAAVVGLVLTILPLAMPEGEAELVEGLRVIPEMQAIPAPLPHPQLSTAKRLLPGLLTRSQLAVRGAK
jgi:hypothetical protein